MVEHLCGRILTSDFTRKKMSAYPGGVHRCNPSADEYNWADRSIRPVFGSTRFGCGLLRTKTPLQADKMLDAAGRLFGAHRFHEVRMEDIAAEAEVGKGTIYRYFSDKEELFLALLERSSRQLLARLEE